MNILQICPPHWSEVATLMVMVAPSPYSFAERRVPGLIPVIGSQPAGDVSHKTGGRHFTV